MRAKRQRRETPATAASTNFIPIRRPYAPVDVMSKEQEDKVHALSLRLLEEIGLKFMSPETWPILEANGCRVDRETGMVRFDPAVIDHFLSLAPSTFTIKARNPNNDLFCGGDFIHYGGASSAPNVTDLDRGRRPGTQADFEALVKLHHMLPTCAFHTGHPVEPIDMPANTRHLTSSFSWQTLSDKVIRIYAIGRTRVQDSIRMAEIANDLGEGGIDSAPRLHASININSPLVMDAPLIEGAMEVARRGQANVITPVAFAGAMSPITLSGGIVQCNAEAIAIIAFLQMVKPGAPCFYGVVSTPIDMKTGAPAMGVPETVTATLANGQMSRRYRMPQRLMLGSTSNAPDAQSAYETMLSLWAGILSGCHFMYHAHGWMEAGLTTSYEKTIIDSDMIGMMGALKGTIDFSDADELLETIAAVGPGGHFLGSPHTLARYKTAFYRPIVSDWRPYEFWSASGAPDTAVRANKIWKSMLEAYSPPDMAPGTREQLREFVDRRRAEIGDSEI